MWYKYIKIPFSEAMEPLSTKKKKQKKKVKVTLRI